MDADHEHDWKPGPAFGKYVCGVPGCGATGWRTNVNNPIRAHKKPQDWSKADVGVGGERKGRRGPGGWSAKRSR